MSCGTEAVDVTGVGHQDRAILVPIPGTCWIARYPACSRSTPPIECLSSSIS